MVNVKKSSLESHTLSFIDIHAHLFFLEDFEIDENVYVINNGLDEGTNYSVLEFEHSRVFKALGSHPSSPSEKNLEVIEKNIDKIIAIGEIGLDYYKYGNFEKQKEIFEKALKIAEEYGLPAIIHSRKAEENVLKILEKFDVIAVLHSYTGPLRLVPRFLEINCYFSIPSLIRRSSNFKSLAKIVPLDRIFFETDSPFMSPFKGRKNNPNNVKIAYEEVSTIKGVPLENVVEAVLRNFEKVFGIKL